MAWLFWLAVAWWVCFTVWRKTRPVAGPFGDDFVHAVVVTSYLLAPTAFFVVVALVW